ncbi:26S proteasome regulatory complex, subunit PSMD10 [Plasmopara halstedii]|uniref:26S proteasome regulatory complex, subunit PSMD10 n=1 Tax=Plasmopara halstedii TaxID=4781 RepID=A0A0N7L8M4_PLAHL|nr:26S proteasome regulatory complex, subunit PSMD10 [Plasmopara halstedii]CEG50283.1 26S proteasome regulatory complex, subunit PSMD10 [Plasmopara halstedii]|eukprot:XP_024586652.1 26S proteasome regulatory complex, subunit PSMD10 [Plasmopara halstedii]
MSANRVISVQTEELFQACEAGNEQVVADLIQDSRADVNWQCKQSYGATPLVVAISNGHLEVVEMLLKANAELGVLKTPDRNSPLHEAASKGDPKILQLVLNKVFDISSDDASDLINFQNQFGNTPLHNAARTGNPKCVAQLLQAGAEYSIRNTNGSIPLHHACYCEKLNLEVVQLLVEAGSDVDALDEQHQSPLIVAAKKNQLEVMKYLRDKGADATLENSFGENAHHFAKLCDNNSNTFQSK